MTAAFDHIAHQYDAAFTRSPIGMLQRKLVWDFLEASMNGDKPLEILELNCGTGEDALWMAQHQHKVLATDISEEMIHVAEQKAMIQPSTNNISFEAMDILDSGNKMAGKTFDMVFSNFGGLNCLSPDELSGWLRKEMPLLLNRGGKMVAVIMPRFCIWESLYFIAKLRFRKAFRRLSKKAVVGKISDGVSVNTWYYSPRWIKKQLPETMTVTAVKPIGFFVPPSYLNAFFGKRKKLLHLLEKAERWICNNRIAAGFSDHYLVEIQRIHI
ncbi:MAG: methyltransferase domain-containing protein [Bacteroidota bacterium]